jgi:hydroxymethylglutaryl-CoA lyase
MPVAAAGGRILVNEVAPRDGLQIEARFVPTADKLRLIDRLSRTGLAKIEVTSFSSPKAIPALADAEAVMLGIERVEGVVYAALVPNVRGAERAFACRADELNLVLSVSETHNLANLRMPREQSFRQLAELVRFSRERAVPLTVSLSCSFGCPIEGPVHADEVFRWCNRVVELGVRSISLADTTGMAHPNQVRGLCEGFGQRWPEIDLTLHFHNSRGMGLANVLAGIEAGAGRFDASLGGLGGCPFAPGATGNICTEDLVHMLQLMGFETGVDLDALIAAARWLPALVGHEVPGQVAKAGKVGDLHPRPEGLDEIAARTLARDGS